MTKLEKLARKARTGVNEMIEGAENRLLAAEGRRSLRQKGEVAAGIAKKAVKAGAIAGALVAVTVAAKQMRRRRSAAR